jgi:putative ATP-dependent endonuclease of OLD family
VRARALSVHNFRCLGHVRVELDDVTTFIGPNGSGKSTLLRALDWFFNGGSMTESDLYSGAGEDTAIWVEVEFDDLTDADRGVLGARYASGDSDAFVARRTWDRGDVKLTGKSRAYPGFEAVRQQSGAMAIRNAFNALLTSDPNLSGIARATTREAVETAMLEWEMSHLDLLEDAYVEATHLHGVAGEGALGRLFSFVLVAADQRAGEEGVDGKKTVFGRILERVLDRSGVEQELAALAEEVHERQKTITTTHLGPGLKEVENLLNNELRPFAVGRTVELTPTPVETPPKPALVSVAIVDQDVRTGIEQQGHGFQRALIIGLLKTLAEQGKAADDDPTIMLAIEEPELFQHPTQARVFARALRAVASNPVKRVQVAYATHSPYFVEPTYFDQIRRVTRTSRRLSAAPNVEVGCATLDDVTAALTGAGYAADAVRQRWDHACTASLSEALFADAAVIVEGQTDRGILSGIASRRGETPFEEDGIAVAPAGTKEAVPILHAILHALGIPTLVVFDNDRGAGDRRRQTAMLKQKTDASIDVEAEAQKAYDDEARKNRKLLAYLGHPEEDFPAGPVSATTYVWEDTLEAQLDAWWPSWKTTRARLIDTGQGVGKKNEATYSLAARDCPDKPGSGLTAVVEAARALLRT